MYNCHFAWLSAVIPALKLSLHICLLVVSRCIYLLPERLDVLWCILTQVYFSLFQYTVISRQGKQIFNTSMLTNVWWLSVHILYVSREAECLRIFFWHNSSSLFFRRLPLQDKVNNFSFHSCLKLSNLTLP